MPRSRRLRRAPRSRAPKRAVDLDRAHSFTRGIEGHQRFLPEHILKVLLDDPEGLASNLIQASGGNPKAAARFILKLLLERLDN